MTTEAIWRNREIDRDGRPLKEGHDLAGCPACAALNVFVAFSVETIRDARKHVECRICKTRGPERCGVEEAVLAWNNLPRPSEPARGYAEARLVAALEAIGRYGDEIGAVPTYDAYGDRRRLIIFATKARNVVANVLDAHKPAPSEPSAGEGVLTNGEGFYCTPQHAVDCAFLLNCAEATIGDGRDFSIQREVGETLGEYVAGNLSIKEATEQIGELAAPPPPAEEALPTPPSTEAGGQ